MNRPDHDPSITEAMDETQAYRALLRREQQIAAIQGSLGWRLLAFYGPYKRRFVQPAWRRFQSLMPHWLRASREPSLGAYGTWVCFTDRIRRLGKHGPAAPNTGQLRSASVSVVITAERDSFPALERALASVIEQDGAKWEVCVAAVACGEPPGTFQQSLPGAMQDPRIRFSADTASTPAEAINAAFASAIGDIIALMPPTAVLTSDALRSAVQAFAATNCDVLYSDEDLLDQDGKRHSPQFKPGWSPDLLLSWMYWSRVVFYRREFLERLMPLSTDFGGAHCYDLALRATEHPARIAHLPRILSHIAAPPTATGGIATTAEREAGQRAIEAALTRRSIAGSVRWHSDGDVYRVQRTVAATSKVSIIIPIRDGLEMLQRCLRAVATTNHSNYEIIIIDNGSAEDATLTFLSETHHKVVRSPGPFNFSRINNEAVKQADGEYLVFLNNDTEPLRANWLRALEEHAQRPEVGAVGAKLLYANGRIQHAGIAVGIGGLAGHPYRFQASAPEGIRNVSAVTAACLMMRRTTFNDLGGFDERLPVNSNDVDLCLRLRGRGFLVIYTPHAILYHHESQTRGARAVPDDAWLMARRWQAELSADPYYSPNFDLTDESVRQAFSKPDGMLSLSGTMGHASGSLRIEPGASGGQRFFAVGGDLCAIAVRVLVEAADPDIALRLTIRESPMASGAVRVVERSAVGRVDDERWFCFEPLPESGGRFWYFFLENMSDRACTLRRAAVISDVMGPCFDDHRPTHGTLVFELFARAPCRCGTSLP